MNYKLNRLMVFPTWIFLPISSIQKCQHILGNPLLLRARPFLEYQVRESKQIGSGQTGDGKSEYRYLGISKLKWTGTGEFNSDDHCIYYSWQESLRRNGVAIIVNKRVRQAVLGCNKKQQNNLFVSKSSHSISR